MVQNHYYKMSCGGHVVPRTKRTIMGSEYSSKNVKEHVRGSHRRYDVRSTNGGREIGVLWRWGCPIFSSSHKCNKAISYGYIPSIILSDWDNPRIKSKANPRVIPVRHLLNQVMVTPDQPLRFAPVNIKREVIATHTKTQSPTFMDSVNIFAQAKGSSEVSLM
jgi:hypothetical protein